MHFYYGWVVVAVLFTVSLFAAATAGFTFGLFVLPMGTELGLSRAALGWTQTARLGASGVASLAIGPFIDRYGTRVLIPVGGAVGATGLWVISSANSYWIILAMFAMLGLFEFSIPGNLPTTVPIGKWFVRKRGKAAAITALGIAAGGVIFSLSHQALIESVGWRDTLRISAVLVFLGTVPLPLLLLRRMPEDMGLHPDGDPTPPIAGAEDDSEVEWTTGQAARTWTMWKIVAAYALTNFASGGFLVHRAPYWAEKGASESIIAMVFALDAMTFALGSLVAWILARHIPGRWLAAWGMLSLGGAAALALFSVSTPALLASPFLFGAGAGINAVVQTVIFAEYYGRRSLGAIRGISVPIMLLGFAIGPGIFGVMYGLAGDSYVSSFWMATIALIASAVTMATATKPRVPERAA